LNGVDAQHETSTGRTRAGAATEQSFPLIALLQSATFLAAVAASIDGRELVRIAGQWRVNLALAVGLPAAASLVGGSLGFVLGLGQLRMYRSALAGSAIGATLGLAILAAYAAPASLPRCAAAAGMLVATTIAFRIRAA
jgi:hypothetical protein